MSPSTYPEQAAVWLPRGFRDRLAEREQRGLSEYMRGRIRRHLESADHAERRRKAAAKR